MFTGLVEEIGTVTQIEGDAEGVRIRIGASLVPDGLSVGDSVAVDGACLTAVAVDPDGFAVDVVAETLRRTVLGVRRAGDRVNLERAVRVGDRLGGHLVQGHVDGRGVVSALVEDGGGRRATFVAGPEILRYVVEKGSIAVDGVSLTVAARPEGAFSVALIPHTLAETTLGELTEGRAVNLEVDLVAKYVEALSAPYTQQHGS